MAGKSQMASLVPDALMEKARLFVRDLPDVYSLKQGWNSIIFELIDKRKMSGTKLINMRWLPSERS
jgi:hypothetical protein